MGSLANNRTEGIELLERGPATTITTAQTTRTFEGATRLFYSIYARTTLAATATKTIVAIGTPPPVTKSEAVIKPTIGKRPTNGLENGPYFFYTRSERRLRNNRVMIALTNPFGELVNSSTSSN